MYYLNSRYYNPELGRFINGDSYGGQIGDILSHNIYTYCLNNPINNYDPNGDFALMAVLPWAISGLTKVLEAAIGIGVGVAIGGNVIDSIRETESSKAKSKTITKTKTEPKDIVIYRYGGANPGNLTPREKDLSTGLSFSTIPRPGAAMTTIKAINSTGIVYAVQDGPFHVSVRPVGVSMREWIEAGSNSIWTESVKSVVIKWEGVE